MTAVDDDGFRSPPSVGIAVDTARSPVDPGDRPAPPTNLRSATYSASAGEVFWERVTGQRLTYEVSLNDEVVATTDGTSYFTGEVGTIDGTRVEGVDYRYELVAIDSRGERSAPTVVGSEDGPPAGLDLLDVGPELLRSLGGYPLDQLTVVVDDLAFTVGQTTTIVWPDDSWYQVQNAETLDEVCNGGPECPIVPGSYVVINHTIGERSPLEVPYVDPADQVDAVPLPASSFSIRGQTIPLDRTRYGCENEGSLTMEVGSAVLELDDFGARGTVEPRRYRFDRCRITVRDGLLPDGGYLVQGNLLTVDTDPFLRFGYADSYEYDELSIVGDDGLAYRVDGEVERYYNEGRIQTARRVATIDGYEKRLPDGQLAESITEGRFYREAVDAMGGPFLYRETLDADGAVRGTLSVDQRVTITTEPVLTRQLVLPRNVTDETFPIPFSGSVELLAEDGSSLYINANPIVPDPELSYSPPLVDYRYTTFFGQEIQRNQFELVDFPYAVRAPNCIDLDIPVPLGFIRNEETGRLECVADGAVPIVP